MTLQEMKELFDSNIYGDEKRNHTIWCGGAHSELLRAVDILLENGYVLLPYGIAKALKEEGVETDTCGATGFCIVENYITATTGHIGVVLDFDEVERIFSGETQDEEWSPVDMTAIL